MAKTSVGRREDQERPMDEDEAGEQSPGVPRWVKAMVLVAALVVVVLVVVMLASGGEHGPGRHGAPEGTAYPTGTRA
jgi:hypothetical protein